MVAASVLLPVSLSVPVPAYRICSRVGSNEGLMSAPPVRSTGVARSVVVVFPPTFMMTVVPLAIVRFALPPRVMLLMFIETVEFVPPTMFRVPPFIVRLPIDRVAPFAVIVTTPEPKTEVHVAGKVTEMPAAREHEPVKLPVDDPIVAVG